MTTLLIQDWRDFEDVTKVGRTLNADGDLLNNGGIPNDPNGQIGQYNSLNLYEAQAYDGPGGKFRSLRGHSQSTYYYGQSFASAGDDIKKIAFSYVTGGVMGEHASGNQNSTLLISNEASALNHGIGVYITQGVLRVYHVAGSPTGSLNSLIIATGPSLRDGAFYHINCLIDITNPEGTIALFLNGEKVIDATFNRDRIVNEQQVLNFTSYNIRCSGSYANICVYTPDEVTPFPMRPIDATRLTARNAAGQAVAEIGYAPNASDGTGVTLAPGQTLSWDLSDVPEGSSPIFAQLRARAKADAGLSPAVIDAEVLRPDGSASVIAALSAPPNSHERMLRKRIPAADLTAAIMNGARIRVSARTEN